MQGQLCPWSGDNPHGKSGKQTSAGGQGGEQPGDKAGLGAFLQQAVGAQEPGPGQLPDRWQGMSVPTAVPVAWEMRFPFPPSFPRKVGGW